MRVRMRDTLDACLGLLFSTALLYRRNTDYLGLSTFRTGRNISWGPANEVLTTPRLLPPIRPRAKDSLPAIRFRTILANTGAHSHLLL